MSTMGRYFIQLEASVKHSLQHIQEMMFQYQIVLVHNNFTVFSLKNLGVANVYLGGRFHLRTPSMPHLLLELVDQLKANTVFDRTMCPGL